MSCLTVCEIGVDTHQHNTCSVLPVGFFDGQIQTVVPVLFLSSLKFVGQQIVVQSNELMGLGLRSTTLLQEATS